MKAILPDTKTWGLTLNTVGRAFAELWSISQEIGLLINSALKPWSWKPTPITTPPESMNPSDSPDPRSITRSVGGIRANPTPNLWAQIDQDCSEGHFFIKVGCGRRIGYTGLVFSYSRLNRPSFSLLVYFKSHFISRSLKVSLSTFLTV